jgi:hypothetical protein
VHAKKKFIDEHKKTFGDNLCAFVTSKYKRKQIEASPVIFLHSNQVQKTN